MSGRNKPQKTGKRFAQLNYLVDHVFGLLPGLVGSKGAAGAQSAMTIFYRHANEIGEFYMSRNQLAELAGCSPSVAQTRIKACVDIGIIRKTGESKGGISRSSGKGIANGYKFQFLRFQPVDVGIRRKLGLQMGVGAAELDRLFQSQDSGFE